MLLKPEHFLHQENSIREALASLDKVQPKLCLIVNANNVLLRTISDGDIRRGLLKFITLDSPISKLPGREPITAKPLASNSELLNLMTQEGVSEVIIVDEADRPVTIKTIADVQEHILLSPPHIGQKEVNYIEQAFETNWIAPAGPNLQAFENQLASISGCKEAIAVSSGTAGLHLALRALGLAEKSTIYVSDKTFIASLQPILYEGLTPILIDSEPTSWNMSPDALERRLARDAQKKRLPGAIIVVHIYGQPAQVDRILPLANQYGIPVIEDAAESLGATYGGEPSGSHGLLGVYSFNGNKIITTSSGGAVVTNDAALAAKVRYLATQGRDPYEHYQHSQIAYNYRLSNVLAGIGLGQLDVLAEHVKRRRAIHESYKKGLQSIPGVEFQNESPNSSGNRWLTVITFDPNYIKVHPYQLMRGLKQQGIEARPSWKPMHMQPLCANFEFEPHSAHEVVSSSLYLTGLCLPSGSNLSDAQVNQVITSISALLEKGCA